MLFFLLSDFFLAKSQRALYCLLQQKQYEAINEWFEARTAEAEIVDNRDYLYAGS